LNIIYFSFIYFIAYLFEITFSYIVCRIKYKKPKLKINLKVWKSLIKNALPYTISILLLSFITNLDNIFLNYFTNEETVGIYSAAYRLVFVLITTLNTVNIALFPSLTNYYNQGEKERFKKLASLAVKFLNITTFFCAIFIFFSSELIIGLIYDLEFAFSAQILKILIWELIIRILYSIYSHNLTSIGKQKYFIYGLLIGNIVHIVANLLITSTFGAIGAAWVRLMSSFAVFVFVYFSVDKDVRVNLIKEIYKPLIISIIVFLMLFLIPLDILLKLGLGIITFIALLFLSKTIQKKELNFLLDFVKKSFFKKKVEVN
jgi:O-antigen/teichoic acid export membrane protein